MRNYCYFSGIANETHFTIMKKDDHKDSDRFFEQQPESDIAYIDLFEYVVKNKTFTMELAEFYVIENGFRECWNERSGELVGDGEFKNYVYRHIEKEVEKKTIPDYIPQPDVDACVDLILEYLMSIGQYQAE